MSIAKYKFNGLQQVSKHHFSFAKSKIITNFAPLFIIEILLYLITKEIDGSHVNT